jgi:hypothetical protein
MNSGKYQYLNQEIISHDVASSFRYAMLSKIILAQYSL